MVSNGVELETLVIMQPHKDTFQIGIFFHVLAHCAPMYVCFRILVYIFMIFRSLDLVLRK